MTPLLPFSVTSDKLIALGVIGALGIVLLIAVGVFAVSIWKQRKYSKTALPEYKDEKDDTDTEDTVSVFSLEGLDEEAPLNEAFAVIQDDEYAFKQVDEYVENPREDSIQLPSLEEHQPEVMLPSMVPDYTLEEKMYVQEETIDEEQEPPPFEEEVIELQPSIPESESNIPLEDLEDEELEAQHAGVFSKLRMSGFDKILNKADSHNHQVVEADDDYVSSEEAFKSNSYAGKRRRAPANNE